MLQDKLLRKKKEIDKVFHSLDSTVVLVEGKRDEAALRAAGVTAPIVLAGGRKAERVAEEAEAFGKPVALLFDWDGEGERKTREYSELMGADTRLRKKMKRLLGLRTVEELGFRLSEFEKKVNENNGKDLHRYGKVPREGDLRDRRHR
ncbi:hypothetical protein COU36_04030 [Candidatus Micrarchaeota archaeon CG10_big_fil_rev_8_21_14_0_10_59_7]|nr:MAG: hypothetical protein COU36_04030 [Candidatus Micrarchaeota archaeon CG10_big_fil_rev_8_21_14_0_10_59_7]